MFIVLLTTMQWGGRWGSNPRPPESQSGALPTELRPPLRHYIFYLLAVPYGVGTPCRIRTRDLRLRRPLLYPAELRAHVTAVNNGRGREIRTPDILLPKQARYQTALYPDILYKACAKRLKPLKRCVYYSRFRAPSSLLFGFFINKTKLLK